MNMAYLAPGNLLVKCTQCGAWQTSAVAVEGWGSQSRLTFRCPNCRAIEIHAVGVAGRLIPAPTAYRSRASHINHGCEDEDRQHRQAQQGRPSECVEHLAGAPVTTSKSSPREDSHMMKIALAATAAAAVLTTAPLVIPVKAEGVRMAQGVDVQVGRDRDRYDRDYRYDRERRDSDVTVGIGPGGVRVGPRERCRMVTTTVEREDGRSITRRERRCD
jgi:hypothetical protein